MKNTVKKMFLQFLMALVLLSAVFYTGIRIGKAGESRTELVPAKEEVRTIAVVNMDQGIRIQDHIVNYGTQLISFTKEHFTSTSLEDARTGVEKGKFAAYVIIPATFSRSVWSINTIPEKAVLEYAVNPNLSEHVIADVIYDLKAFEMKMNTDISYLYLYAILDEFHSGQDSAVVIMKNDREDAKQLASIVPAELLQPLEFVELQALTEYPEEINLDNSYLVISNAAEGMEQKFDSFIEWAEDDLKELQEDREPVEERMENMRTVIADLTLLEDEQGDLVYEEGRAGLIEGLEKYQDTIDAERSGLKEAFRWVGRRDTLASASDAEPMANTWLDEVEQEQKRQKAAYEQELNLWKETFDYSRLATASNATPSDATPSDATPSDATPSDAEGWLVERDHKVVTSAVAVLYARMMEEMGQLCLYEEDLEAILDVLERNCSDEILLRELAAAAGSAYPLEVRLSPEAEEYIKHFFDEMPVQTGKMTGLLDDIARRISAFSEEQIQYLDHGEAVPVAWFKEAFGELIVRSLEKQETWVQEWIAKELNHLEESFQEYMERLDKYNPLEKVDDGDLNLLRRQAGDGVREIEKLINSKSDRDREYISMAEKKADENIKLLQDSMDASYEGTSQNITRVLEDAKQNRSQLNRHNEDMLEAFTQKLPYTRNGSVANTETYDVLVNPISVNEKKLTGRYEMIRTTGLKAGGMILGIFLLSAATLAAQNSMGTEKKRRREERGGDE